MSCVRATLARCPRVAARSGIFLLPLRDASSCGWTTLCVSIVRRWTRAVSTCGPCGYGCRERGRTRLSALPPVDPWCEGRDPRSPTATPAAAPSPQQPRAPRPRVLVPRRPPSCWARAGVSPASGLHLPLARRVVSVSALGHGCRSFLRLHARGVCLGSPRDPRHHPDGQHPPEGRGTQRAAVLTSQARPGTPPGEGSGRVCRSLPPTRAHRRNAAASGECFCPGSPSGPRRPGFTGHCQAGTCAWHGPQLPGPGRRQ